MHRHETWGISKRRCADREWYPDFEPGRTVNTVNRGGSVDDTPMARLVMRSCDDADINVSQQIEWTSPANQSRTRRNSDNHNNR